MWRRIRAVGIGVALVVIAVGSISAALWMIYAANRREVAYQQYAKSSAATDAYRGRIYEIRSCGPLSTAARAKCVAEQYYAAHQAQHDDRDLEAQRTTAVWTRYLGIAGILGTAFGTIGVLLVLLTFGENRRAADAAHNANRPWVEGEKPHEIQLSLTAEGIKLSAFVDVVNHGNSPALRVLAKASWGMKSMADETTPSIPLSGIEEALTDWQTRHDNRGVIAFPNKPARLIIECELPVEQIRTAEKAAPDDCFFLLAVGISYRFGKTSCRTVNVYAMMTKTGRTLCAAPYSVPKNTELRLKDGELKLADTLEGYAT